MIPQASCPDAGRWSELLEGQLPAREQAELNRHLEACTDCQQMLEGLTTVEVSWPEGARLGEQPRPAHPVLRRVMEDLKTEGSRAGLSHSGDVGASDLTFLRPPQEAGCIGQLGTYQVLGVIGRGGMGVVLKALDPALQRLVAIKVLAPQWATSASARQRFEREGRAIAAVRHEHVVAVYAVEEAEGLPYLVMEYVPGVSLQQHLDDRGPLELEEILRIGMQTAFGLAAAHQQGLIHRDVKPANILLEEVASGECRVPSEDTKLSSALVTHHSPLATRVKLTDFGLARAVDDASLTQSGVIAGTPQYMAPEQARGTMLDHRADLFSLGSVLYALCTGQPPFRASTTLAVLRSVCEDTPQPIRDLNQAIPDWLVEIIEVLHAKDPADRFQSADELARLFRQHLRHLRSPGQVRMPRRVTRRKRSQWRRPRRLLFLVPLFLLLAGLVGWACWSAFGSGAALQGTGLPPLEEGPTVLLANGRLVRQGGLSSFQVDYQVLRGNLPGALVYVWVVESPRGRIHEQNLVPVHLGTQGTLKTTRLFPMAMTLGGNLETYLAINTGGLRRRISNTIPLR